MIEPEILNTPLEDIHLMKIPYLGISNSTERLKRIIYSARWHLTDRSPDEIKQACADVLYLYQYYFKSQAEKLRSDLEKSEDPVVYQYLDVEKYIESHVESLKLDYLSEFDVLNALTYIDESAALNQIEGVKSDFSDIEFFSALALYCSSNAFSKIFEAKNWIEDNNINEFQMMPAVIVEICDAVLDAQMSLEHARQLKITSDLESSNLIQDYLKDSRRSLAKKAIKSRYTEKYQQRRLKAVELYENGSFRTRFDAALHLIEPIQEFSKQLDIPLLKLDSAQDTIYKWLSEHTKEKI